MNTDETRELSDAEWSALFASFPPTSTEEWVAQIRADLGSPSEEQLSWHLAEGLALRPFYRRADVERFAPFHDAVMRQQGTALSEPGNAWRIRQDFATADLRASNELARNALANGVEEIGFGHTAGGAWRCNPDDIQALTEGIDLTGTTVHFMHPEDGGAMLATLLDEADRRGMEPASLTGSIEWNPLGDFLGGRQASFDGDLPEIVDSFETLEQLGSPMRLLAVDARPLHDAGDSAVQQVAFALASLSEYLALLTDAGFTASRAGARLKLIMPVGSSFFPEIAKLRAVRLLAANVVSAYGDDGGSPIPLLVETSYGRQDAADPYSNLLRGTTQAIAAILGGAETITVRPFNLHTEEPDLFGYRLAYATQLILRHEAHLGRVEDAVGGSYYVEALTDALCREAWSRFQEIESGGGLKASASPGSYTTK